ncbi:hypothetical protein [Sphingosinicella sp. BN140058]|nr:hypothetical protein [Sphingosinicella sp. BN140058]
MVRQNAERGAKIACCAAALVVDEGSGGAGVFSDGVRRLGCER